MSCATLFSMCVMALPLSSERLDVGSTLCAVAAEHAPMIRHRTSCKTTN